MKGNENKKFVDGRLENVNAPEQAKEAERLLRRHSTQSHVRTGELHSQAVAFKAA